MKKLQAIQHTGQEHAKKLLLTEFTIKMQSSALLHISFQFFLLFK
jgi:hypothetical protein